MPSAPALQANGQRAASPATHRLVILAAALAGAVVAANALGNGFAFDDSVVIEGNTYLHRPGQLLEGLARPYWPTSGALWRPAAQLVFALCWFIGDGAPLVYHAANLVMHAVVSGLVAALALRVISPFGAVVAGVLFALFPIHVEAVANGVGMAELLCTAGLLVVALRAARVAPVATRSDGWWLAAAAALALGGKEIGVAAPIIAWAAARAMGTRANAWQAAGWTIAGILPLLIGRYLVLGALGGDQPHAAWVGLGPLAALMLALRTLAVGAGWLLIPRAPVFEHSPPLYVITHPEWWLVVAGIGLVILAIWATWRHWRQGGPWSFAMLWWGATILPVSNVLFRSGIVLADRNLYAPSVAAALLAGLLAAELWALSRTPTAIAAGLLGAWCGATAWRDMPVWHDTERVVDAFVARAPTSYLGWLYRGQARLWRGQRALAKDDFDHGIAAYNRESRLLYERSILALQDADTARAIAWLEQAVAVHPRANRARQVLLDVLTKRGQTARVQQLLRDGVAVAPDQRRWQAALRAPNTLP